MRESRSYEGRQREARVNTVHAALLTQFLRHWVLNRYKNKFKYYFYIVKIPGTVVSMYFEESK